MSKGCFRVVTFLPYDKLTQSSNALDMTHIGYDGDHVGETYVVKSNIVIVQKVNTYIEYRAQQALDGSKAQFHLWLDLVMKTAGYKDNELCTCDCRATLDEDDDFSYSCSYPEEGECTCYLPFFPFYEIVVTNHDEKASDYTVAPAIRFVPPTATYIVHQSEREHMERYLAGTDDAMWDLVHALRYMPSNVDVVRAASSFDDNNKKRSRPD